MSLLDLTAALSLLGGQSYVFTHYGPQTVDGSGTASDDASIGAEEVLGSLQPFGQELLQVGADGERLSAMFNFFTLGELSPRLGNQPGDTVEIDGDTYRVVGARKWTRLGGYNEYTLEREP